MQAELSRFQKKFVALIADATPWANKYHAAESRWKTLCDQQGADVSESANKTILVGREMDAALNVPCGAILHDWQHIQFVMEEPFASFNLFVTIISDLQRHRIIRSRVSGAIEWLERQIKETTLSTTAKKCRAILQKNPTITLRELVAELSQESSGKPPCSEKSGAESGSLSDDSIQNADLRMVIDAWPRLTERAWRAMVAIALNEASRQP